MNPGFYWNANRRSSALIQISADQRRSAFPKHLVCLSLVCALLAFPHAASAQTRQTEALDRKEAFDDSLALFQVGDSAFAEEILLSTNRRESETFEWRLESAGKLTHMAFALRNRHDPLGAIAVARRALAHLEEAKKLAGSVPARRRAGIYELTAVIARDIFREPAMARTAFETALQINPQSSRAQEGLAWLDAEAAKSTRLAESR